MTKHDIADWQPINGSWFLSLIGCMTAALLAIGLAAPAHARSPSHEIVSEDIRDGVAIFSVRLDDRLSEADVKALAHDIRTKAPPAKQPQSIKFFLSAMALSAPAWADVDFGPDARVTIRGLRLEEERAFRAEAAGDQRALIGVWLTSPPALTGKLTIWRDKNKKLFSEWQLRTGIKTVDALTEIRSQRGRRYAIDGSDGGYYLALWNGELELGDATNVVAIAERLTINSKPPLQAAASAQPQTPPSAEQALLTAGVASESVPPIATRTVRKRKMSTIKAAPIGARSRAPTSGDLISAAVGR